MRPFKRKSRLQQLATSVRKDLPGRPSEKTVKRSLMAAGGLAGLTAGSASISSLRRRGEEEDDS